MGPFYEANTAASTTCAARRIGNFAGANLVVENIVNGNSLHLSKSVGMHQGRKPDSTRHN